MLLAAAILGATTMISQCREKSTIDRPPSVAELPAPNNIPGGARVVVLGRYAWAVPYFAKPCAEKGMQSARPLGSDRGGPEQMRLPMELMNRQAPSPRLPSAPGSPHLHPQYAQEIERMHQDGEQLAPTAPRGCAAASGSLEGARRGRDSCGRKHGWLILIFGVVPVQIKRWMLA